MKKFGFRTSSITFKALCIILPIQFLFLILGYRHVQDLIFEAENEKREKFESEKSALEEILKELFDKDINEDIEYLIANVIIGKNRLS